MDDRNVRLGRAYVVLENETLADTRGHRPEPG